MKALTRKGYIKTESSIRISELEGTARGVGNPLKSRDKDVVDLVLWTFEEEQFYLHLSCHFRMVSEYISFVLNHVVCGILLHPS